MSAYELLELAAVELDELKAAVWGHEQCVVGADRVESEAADVSAFVAMVADRCR